MLDTRFKKALERSIVDFNEWSLKRNTYGQFPSNDVIGVFTDKLKRNMKENGYEFSNCFNPELISCLELENCIIKRLAFNPLNWRWSPDVLQFAVNCNRTLREVDLRGLSSLPFESQIRNIIASINDFRIC